ncbi:MAG: FAD-binding protein [Anaerolineae bacterium]
MTFQRVETEVLVIGAGGAGFRAAIEARQRGARALLVSKGPLARSGATPLAGADLTADGRGLAEIGFPGEPRDSQETWFRDIVHQGFFLNNQRLAELYVREAVHRVKELVDWGLKVRSSDQRAIYTTGTHIADTLLRRAKTVGVETAENVMVLHLIVKGGHVVGAVGLDLLTGEFVVFQAKAIVLATGGWHKAYTPTTGTTDLSGDGVAMAYRAGAELANMEFVTFCCSILLWPPRWQGSLFTYILQGMGAVLTNREGERFLEKYDPVMVQIGTSTEWDKSFVSYASAQEIRAGKGSPHGGVFFGVEPEAWDAFDRQVEAHYPNWRYKGADFSELRRMLREGEPVEVGPAVEYFEGGISVNERFETSLPGLHAAGECATGLFGANRVAAATTEMLVTGALAGRSAAEHALQVRNLAGVEDRDVEPVQARAMQPLARPSGLAPGDLKRRIQKMAHENLGPVRTEREIQEFLAFLEEVKKDALPCLCTRSKSQRYNRDWIEALELENVVQVLEASARSALARTESRGVHYRADCPQTDNDRWLKELVVTRAGSAPSVSVRPVVVTSLVPPGGVVPYLEMMKRMMEAHSDVGGPH